MYFLEENIRFNTLHKYKTFQNWISIQHDKCTFCKTEQEALFPILCYCLYSNIFWKNVEQYYLTKAKGFEDALCLRDVIIGITMSSCHSLNYVMLTGNLYLWDCRKNQVLANIEGFKFNVT